MLFLGVSGRRAENSDITVGRVPDEIPRKCKGWLVPGMSNKRDRFAFFSVQSLPRSQVCLSPRCEFHRSRTRKVNSPVLGDSTASR